VEFAKNCRGAAASRPTRLLSVTAGFKCLVLATALLASAGPASAAPQGVRQPAMHPVDDRGLLDSVADRGQQLIDGGQQLISGVRDGASGLVESAMNFLGVRYKRGGNSAETGFDCSGFTRYVFENSIGRVLPHRADEQANSPELMKVEQKDLKPGDLVFFNTLRRTFSHVGIYVGDGKFIHAPRTGGEVRVESMGVKYWAKRFTGARRAPASVGPLPDAAASPAETSPAIPRADDTATLSP